MLPKKVISYGTIGWIWGYMSGKVIKLTSEVVNYIIFICPIYTLIVLKILNPLNAVLMMTPGSCGCQCSSLTSVWPWWMNSSCGGKFWKGRTKLLYRFSSPDRYTVAGGYRVKEPKCKIWVKTIISGLKYKPHDQHFITHTHTCAHTIFFGNIRWMKLTFIGKAGCPCPIKCKSPWPMGNHCPTRGQAFTTKITPAVSGYSGV